MLNTKRTPLQLLQFVLILFTLILFLPAQAQESPQPNGTLGDFNTIYIPLLRTPFDTFYISKDGDNSDGTSWSNAWRELDQVDWSKITPGTTLVIDGGSSEMVYRTTMLIENVHGTVENPITIKLSDENGRNGQAVIFGGRSTPLPYCDQDDYDFEEIGVNSYGFYLDNSSHIIIDGGKRSGIVVYGHNSNGMRFNSNTANITTRHLEIYDNGFAKQSGGTSDPDGAGVRLGGPNHVFEKMIVHDNGQDAFQSGSGQAPNFNTSNLGNLTIRDSWLYNGRSHPTVNESSNYCSHTDGLQIFNGTTVSDILIEGSIIGPGFTNSLILGQTPTSGGLSAVVNNVTIRDVLFMKPADNNIRGYARTKPENWVIENTTSYCPQTKGHCIYIEGDNHTVTNSIFVEAAVTFPDTLDNMSGNCQWDASGVLIGLETDPQFADVDGSDMFSLDDYTVGNSNCAGSTITTVDQLLAIIDSD